MRRLAVLTAALALLAVPALAADRSAAEAAMRRAVAAFGAGDPRGARVEMQNALKADPGWGAARAMQGRIALALDDGLGAEAEFDRARRAGVPDADIAAFVAHAHVLNGDADAALAELDQYRLPPGQAAYAARIRAQAMAAKGDMIAGEAAFEHSLALAPKDVATWVALGRFRMDAADQAGAVAAADRAMALAPRSVDAVVLKGILVRNQYGLVAALPWFERAVDIDPQDVDALLETAATLGDLGRARDMLAMTRRALALDARNVRAFYLLAVLAARAHDYGLARSMIQRTGDALDDVPGAMLLHAVLEIDSGSYEQAIARLDRLASMQPENLRVRRLLGAAQWRAGNYRDAVDALRPIADRPDADAYTLTVVGRSLEAIGERDFAAPYLDRASAPSPGSNALFGVDSNLGALSQDAAIDRGAPARIRYIRGLLSAGRGDQALAEARTLQRANAGTPAAHILVGDALIALGQPLEAAEAYRLAANISFSEPVALRMIDALDRGGNRAAAMETLRLFLTQNPRNVAALLLASDHFQRVDDWGESIRILEGLRARMGNRDALILNNLAWAWFRSGDPDKGLAYAGRAYALTPANPAAADTLGWLLFDTGTDRRAGIELLEKARAIAPAAPAIHWHLAQAYAAVGRKPEAARAAHTALASPGFGNAAEAQALIAKL
jgi:tetratricopeptide (TPR) repeat protein